jgi:hypothetical protein
MYSTSLGALGADDARLSLARQMAYLREQGAPEVYVILGNPRDGLRRHHVTSPEAMANILGTPSWWGYLTDVPGATLRLFDEGAPITHGEGSGSAWDQVARWASADGSAMGVKAYYVGRSEVERAITSAGAVGGAPGGPGMVPLVLLGAGAAYLLTRKRR